MAKGTDAEEFMVVSGARSGLKREFAFALKVQSELSGSLGQRRGKKVQNSHCFGGGSEDLSSKRLKSSGAAAAGEDEEEESLIPEENGGGGNPIQNQNQDQDQDLSDGPIKEELESTAAEPLSDLAKPSDAEESSNVANNAMSNGEKALKEEVAAQSEAPIVSNENCNAPVVKPLLQYTRNTFRAKAESMNVVATAVPKAEPVDVVVTTAVSSGSSVVSEDACKNESVEKDVKMTDVDVVSPIKTPPASKLEMKMSKKIALTKLPTRIKELLQTGMLEGLSISYRAKKNGVLCGTIKDLGILCSCSNCGGENVITPFQFEKHAGSANKHPAEYIYLDNGNSLRDVLNACKDAPLDSLEAAIERAISPSAVRNSTICQNCKEPLLASRITKTSLFCSSCLESKKSQATPTPRPRARVAKSALIPKVLSGVSKFATPQTKSSQGKLTRKDLRLHKLVFEEDGLPDGTELAYYIRGQKLLEGYKKGSSIFCRCCSSEVSPSQFEAHAGWSSRRKPYLNIYTSNGVSLHELSVSLSRGRKLSGKDNDDLCSICANFGDLLLCDGCPRAFHRDCVGLADVPSGRWYCPYCVIMYQREKSCGYNANAKAAGRVDGVDPIEQITKRCIRIVQTTETEIGGCVLCRSHGFCKSGFGPRTVILCDQCEKEFHVGCLKEHNMADLKELPQEKWFCSVDCKRIHTVLQKCVVSGPEKLPDALSSVIKKKHEGNDGVDNADLDVRWCLISGKIASPESKVLLAKAVAIFHDRFDPINDATSGRDLIPSMVYGRNIRDQDFEGMYCAILTVNSSVVSAGLLRVFGHEVAELPLVATSADNQGKGYFQSLFSCIERLLAFLNVTTLVLPAAEEAESIWSTKFTFQKMDEEQLSKYRKNFQLVSFQGTSMLQKAVPKCRIIKKSTTQS
ncbi:hypothetical protein Scep_005283 [Stephania cephalantha]|uniref:PHD-type domain-containing protein n=1 Tax=Stephania cephalantha TaxID=152367 RepID=A0AAP0PY20_9MAGN